MKRLSFAANLFLMGFSVLIGVMSFELGIGDPSNMGPGFLPLVGCVILFCTCAIVLILEWRTAITTEKIELRSFVKPAGVCLVLLGYTFLLSIFGYPVLAFIATFVLSFLLAPQKWVTNLVFATTTAVVTYTFFNLFGLGLPSGLFRLGW